MSTSVRNTKQTKCLQKSLARHLCAQIGHHAKHFCAHFCTHFCKVAQKFTKSHVRFDQTCTSRSRRHTALLTPSSALASSRPLRLGSSRRGESAPRRTPSTAVGCTSAMRGDRPPKGVACEGTGLSRSRLRYSITCRRSQPRLDDVRGASLRAAHVDRWWWNAFASLVETGADVDGLHDGLGKAVSAYSVLSHHVLSGIVRRRPIDSPRRELR